MDAKKIEELTDDELAAEITAQAESLFKYRFQLATGQLEHPAKLRAVRRLIARLKTARRWREIKKASVSA